MSTAPPALDFFWAEITGKCQLACAHCYADSGPTGTHGTMTIHEWNAVISHAAQLGARIVQFIGGEPTLHPGLPTLIGHALREGLEAEVYTNLVHVTPATWEVFAQPGVRLATSYYTDDPDQHQQITGRMTLHRTRTNIAQALTRGIPIRVGIIDIHDGQHVDQARAQLVQRGVTKIGVDRMRLLGRPAQQACDASELCGRCGDGIAAILPDGTVTPCPLARWMSAGNVRNDHLSELYADTSRLAAKAGLHLPNRMPPCKPDGDGNCEPSCRPGCDPALGCQPPGPGGDPPPPPPDDRLKAAS
ncbi:radical SAM/SPASM domain-containing protein [Nonomuraea sp. NPDC059007]|uniref:radical SAM/SPASM domain-containing protein n=1 Tax=Nonomuraea sp. NPDC059007 TaxID=3346692 RepID=UPI00367F60CA